MAQVLYGPPPSFGQNLYGPPPNLVSSSFSIVYGILSPIVLLLSFFVGLVLFLITSKKIFAIIPLVLGIVYFVLTFILNVN